MDVTFTNVLEGARQYFQGLPSAQAQAADSPFYRHHQQQQQHGQQHAQQATSTLQPSQQHQVPSQQHLNHHPTSQHFTQNPTNQHHSNPSTNQQYNLTSQQYAQVSQQYSQASQQYSQTGQHYSQTSQRYGQPSQQFVSQQVSSQQISSQPHSNQQLSSQQVSSQQVSSHHLSSQQLPSQQHSSQQPSQSRQHGSPAYSHSNSAGPPTPQSPWADQNRPPTRERTPTQRPSSHSSDGSRPPSHQSQQSFQTQEQTARQFQPQNPVASQQYQNLYQKEPPTSQPMAQSLQQQQQQQQGYNFSQPQSRDPYRSHIPTSSTYTQPTSSQLSRSSSKEQLAQPVQNYQYSSAYPKSQYGYAQGAYYSQQQAKNNSTSSHVKMSASEAYPTSTQNSYKPQTVEPYPNSNQRLNPYLQVTNNDRFNQQRYLTDNANSRTQVSVSHSQSTQPVETSYRNSHTHNLPPIAALSSYHSSRTSQQKEPNKEQPNASSYSRDPYFHSNSSSIIKPNQAQSFTSVASTLPHITSHQQQSNVSQSVSSYPHSNTITTSSYSSVIMSNVSSTNVQPLPQSYYHGPNKAFLKNSDDYRLANNQVNANLNQNLASRPSTVVESKGVPVIKENPLDLSVKTVKTTADSTLQESETCSKAQQIQRPNSQNHIYPTFDLQKNLTQRTQPPSALSAPKVDFQPKFNIPTTNRQTFLTEKTNPNLQKSTPNPYNTSYRKSEVNVNVSKLPYNNQNPSSHVNPYQYNHYRPSNLPPSNYMPDPRQQNIPRSYPMPDTKKRAGEVTSSVIPEKIPKIEPWRQSIDLQIEQKLSTYKQEKLHSPSERPNATSNYPSVNARDVYNYNQREQYKNSISQPAKTNPNVSVPYTHHQTNHTQTFVPTPNAHQYSNYNQLPKHLNNHLINPYAAALNPMLPPNMNKNQISGSVDRKTLNLLRNSIETKEQKKIEQLKTQENLPLHPRPDIQHSNTDVTAPLQPKLGVVGRNNVSPFTPTSFPETNMASMYKLNPLKPPIVNNHQTQLKDLVKLEGNNTVIVNNTHSGSDYDGLAAFLAARIRTKGEMKQVGPISNQARIQKYVNDQINSPPLPLSESPLVQNASLNSTQSSSESISPPKLSKEMSSRKRLFSKTEEEQSVINNVPRRDKTGIRSSSETSVFDFDDDDDNQMPVLERQSLEAMRRDRRSSLKTTSISLDEIKQEENKTVVDLPPNRTEPSRTPSPFDDIFNSICDNFVDFLKNGPKKRGRKKKADSESPIDVKTETPDPISEQIDFTRVAIKKELVEEESNKIENNNIIESTITPHKIGILSDSDLSDSEARKEDRLAVRNKNKVRRKILSSSESSDEESKGKSTEKIEEKENIDKVTIKIKEEVTDKNQKEDEAVESKNSELIKPADIKKEKIDVDPPIIETKPPEADIKLEPVQKTDVLTVIRPAKKPLFGTGSEFCQPGWEEEVFRYKKSLRMPSSLIQVTRPPNSRLSTSLPDLDPPCPPSPTPSMVTDSEASKDCNNKKVIKKFKSEPIDSDSESTTSFNIFRKKTNYDSEESTSSLPNTKKEKSSILDKLLEKCGGRKKRQYNRKDDHIPKVVPKSDNNLLATPGFEASEKESPVKDKKIKGPIVSEKSALLNFRKDTIKNFKDAFIKGNNTVISNKFATVVLTSRTRKETKALQQRATIKEVFGAERPASAPPCEMTAMNNVTIKEEVLDKTEFSVKLKEMAMQKEAEVIKQIKAEIKEKETKDEIKENFEKGDKDIKEKDETLVKEIKQEILDDSDEEMKLIEFVIKRDPDAKLETTSLDSEEGLTNKRRNKFGKLRRKLSSGFDYIRKKKKIKKEVVSETGETPPCGEKKKRLSNKTLESVDDIQKEIKTWVLNKGIGETHLHRAARLGYTDITAYCLEKTDCHPSPKDNAGYTPLHEACSRGHLQIAKLLLMYGANVHESAQGGIRPLHMAVENGYVEIVRLLLSYGADPSLGTYAGMTPISLANDEDTKDLLLHHLADRKGDRGTPWQFRGPAACFDDPEDLGYDIFDSPPKMESEHELDDIDFEVSESMLPNLYTIRNESQADKWVLLQDLSNYLKVKSRDTLLRQLSSNNDQVSARTLIRELKMADFLEQARCCQFLNQGEKLNTRANKIALVKYNDKVKELLGIEMVTVSR